MKFKILNTKVHGEAMRVIHFKVKIDNKKPVLIILNQETFARMNKNQVLDFIKESLRTEYTPYLLKELINKKFLIK